MNRRFMAVMLLSNLAPTLIGVANAETSSDAPAVIVISPENNFAKWNLG